MFFLQESTPDTTGFMIAGYAVAFVIMGLYLASLVIRQRNLDRDLETLESLRPAKRTAPAAPKKPARKKPAAAKSARKTK
jgi:hypothetical protein